MRDNDTKDTYEAEDSILLRWRTAVPNQFMNTDEPFTIGVEEEYQIVHPATRELRSRAQLILPEAQAALGKQVTPELYQSQIEIGTSICHTLAEVRANIVRLRGEVIAAAEKYGNRIVAAGMSGDIPCSISFWQIRGSDFTPM